MKPEIQVELDKLVVNIALLEASLSSEFCNSNSYLERCYAAHLINESEYLMYKKALDKNIVVEI